MIEEALAGNTRVVGFCPNCGKAIPARKGRGRRRIFCSEKCRSKYAREHPSKTSWMNIQELKMVPIERTASCQLLPFISGGRTYLRQTVDRKKP